MNGIGEPVYVGRQFGGREIRIEEELVKRYTDAVRNVLPCYAQTAPALLLHSECYNDLDWYLANIYGNLHARQEWELYHPLAVGSTVTTRSFIRDRYRKRGRDYVVKETWVLDPEGRLANRGITHQSFLIDKDPAGGGAPVVDKKKADSRANDKRANSAERTAGAGSGDGPMLEALERTVDEDMCMAFSGPGENYHTNREAARALGFPDIVVQGMLSTCFISEQLSGEFGEGWLCGGKMDVKLINVLWAGESVRTCAQIKEEVPEAGRTRVHMDVWVEKSDGTKVTVGNASAIR